MHVFGRFFPSDCTLRCSEQAEGRGVKKFVRKRGCRTHLRSKCNLNRSIENRAVVPTCPIFCEPNPSRLFSSLPGILVLLGVEDQESRKVSGSLWRTSSYGCSIVVQMRWLISSLSCCLRSPSRGCGPGCWGMPSR